MPHVVVTGQEGLILQPDSVSLTWEINKGWTGSLDYPQNPPMDLPDDGTVTIALYDDLSNSLTSPPMRLRKRREREVVGQGESGGYQLIDETSAILASAAENFDTFLDGTSEDVVTAIATRFSRTISGVTEFPIWKEDVKQASGWEPLRRLAAVAGQQLVVNTDGSVSFVTNAWTTGAASFKAAAFERNYDPADIFGKIYVSKNLGAGTASGVQIYEFDTPGFVSSQALTSPITPSNVEDLSTDGGARWVTFFNEDDQVCAQFPLNGGEPDVYSEPIGGDGPAVRFSILVVDTDDSGETKVRIRVTGAPPNPPPSGVDVAISETYGTGRGWPGEFSETLIPSKAWADTYWPAWLQEINRGKHVITADLGHLDAGVRIGQSFSRFGKLARVEKITWNCRNNAHSVNVHGEVLTSWQV